MDKVMELAKAIRSSSEDKNKTSPYDTTAEVVSVEGGTAWVKIPGGIDRTPATMVVDAKVGDLVRVNISGGKAYVTGNASAPPTDDSYAKKAEAQALRATKAADAASEQAAKAQTSADNAEKNAQRASKAADNAAEDAGAAKSAAEQAQSDADPANTLLGQMQDAAEDAGTTLTQIYADAEEAKETTDEINDYAETAGKTVTQILNDGETAGQAAQEAKASAENASEYAARALGNLSTVQSVTETLNWITAHGTMSLTQDQQLDPTHVYFVVDQNGDYEVRGTYYSVVTEPDVADISTYYELSIDESLNNYVGTHLAVTSEGLWLIPEENATPATSSKKILIATGGQGHIYEDAGTYIIGKENGSDVIVAKFTTNGAQMGMSGETHAEIDYHSLQLIDKEGNSYFHVSDLRDNNGEAILQDQYYALGKTRFDLGIYASSITSVLINSTETTSYTVDRTSDGIRAIVLNAPTANQSDIVTVNYISTSELAKAFTIGIRDGLTGVGAFSVAEGYLVRAKGAYTHAEGRGTKATSNYAHAEGCQSQANGLNSHAEGYNTKANGDFSHAEGDGTKADGNYSHAEGFSTTASGSDSHAEGIGNTASGDYSHVEGSNSEASGIASHAEGFQSEASEYCSHAEGYSAEASGWVSHSEGFSTYARGKTSHAEGDNTYARGETSHAEGYKSKADGDYSHAQNNNTIARRKSQTAIGEFNVADTGGSDGTKKGNYVLIIGNGTADNARSNALTVSWAGDVEAAGDIEDGSGNILANKIEAGDVPANETDPTVPAWAKAASKPSYTSSEVGAVDMTNPMVTLDTAASTGTDHDLYAAIVALGWGSDVIV